MPVSCSNFLFAILASLSFLRRRLWTASWANQILQADGTCLRSKPHIQTGYNGNGLLASSRPGRPGRATRARGAGVPLAGGGGQVQGECARFVPLSAPFPASLLLNKARAPTEAQKTPAITMSRTQIFQWCHALLLCPQHGCVAHYEPECANHRTAQCAKSIT